MPEVESKLVGRVSPLRFNTTIDDVVEETIVEEPEVPETPVVDEPEVIVENQKTEVVVEAPVVETVPVTEPPIPEPGRTHAAILAEVFKESGRLPEDYVVDDNMSPIQLVEMIDNMVDSRVQEQVATAEQAMKDTYESQYDEELIAYLDYVRKGGDVNALFNSLSYRTLFGLELTGETQAARDNRKAVIRSRYEHMGLPKRRIDNMIDDLFGKDELDEENYEESLLEAKEGVQYFKDIERREIETLKAQQDAYAEEQKEFISKTKNKLQSKIKSGVIGTVKLTRQEQADLDNFIFNPTELIDIFDENGKKRKRRVSGYTKAQYELQQDLEKQLVFALLLKDGFDLTNVQSKAKEELNTKLLEGLGGKVVERVVVSERDVREDDLPEIQSIARGKIRLRR